MYKNLIQPWLDDKNTIFGRVVSGQDVVQKIEYTKVNRKEKPYEPIYINSIEMRSFWINSQDDWSLTKKTSQNIDQHAVASYKSQLERFMATFAQEFTWQFDCDNGLWAFSKNLAQTFYS